MILVVGQPRTGTSLMMQMLAVAGVKMSGIGPAFEDPRSSAPAYRFDWIKDDQAAKVLWSTSIKIPRDALVIVTCRNAIEQSKAEYKFGQFMGTGMVIKAPSGFVRRGSKQFPKWQRELLDDVANTKHKIFYFEETINDPMGTARKLAEFIGRQDANIADMASVVIKRDHKCFHTMLEPEIMSRWAEREKRDDSQA